MSKRTKWLFVILAVIMVLAVFEPYITSAVNEYVEKKTEEFAENLFDELL